jgi:hypothetical protein
MTRRVSDACALRNETGELLLMAVLRFLFASI